MALHPSSTPITFLIFGSNTQDGNGPNLGAYERNFSIQLNYLLKVFKEGVIICLKSHRETKE